MKRTKLALLAFVVSPTLMAFGCGGDGLWGNLHNFGIHVSQLTQWIAALNQLGTTTT